jgi:tetratricopeptide (TPR) repeat protein
MEALRWYDAGVAALREGNNVKATRSLQESLKQDNHFVMAHARLAEAWANLDFDGNAQRELLVATPGGRQLQPLDRMYLDAIHATVTKDFPAEIAIYRQILNRLPPDQKSSGYVDLGVAYERAGDPKHALESYARAASLDSDNPAPFMHTAVLQSRQHHVPEADRAFERAQTLLTAEMNQEGLAELDYARGYSANEGGNSVEAKQFLERSLDEAGKIPSVQLQIRALTQLSSVASRSDATSQAAKYAEQAIRLARENQLDAWAVNGLVRLASVEIHQGEMQKAEDSLHEALQLAHQSQQLRAEALANLTLASLMNQKHRPDEVIGPAEAALNYYQRNGYFMPASNASLLLIRTQRDKGQYKKALDSGNAFLDLASKSGNRDFKRQAEEVVGTVLIEMEHYSEALVHFQNAMSLADTNSFREYEAINAAIALWRLGRYAESDQLLQFVPANDKVASLVGVIRTDSLLSRQRYVDSLSVAKEMLAKYPGMAFDDREGYELDKALAESHLGMKRQALKDWDELAKQDTIESPLYSKRNLVAAEVSLATGITQQAYDIAAKAATHYGDTEQLDSELRSVCLAAVAARTLHNSEEHDAFQARAVDIISQIEHTWSPQDSHTYLSRPDLQVLVRQIPGDTPRHWR